jgi:hypothetical protein
MNILKNADNVVVFGTDRAITEVDGSFYIDDVFYKTGTFTIELDVLPPETVFINDGYTYLNGIWAVHAPALVQSVQPKNDYRQKRKGEYLSVEQQLEFMFDHGFDAWKAHIQSIKDKYPKPE